MPRRMLLTLLLCVLLIQHSDAAKSPPLRSMKPDPKFSAVPSQDFISDICRMMVGSVQLVPWPVRPDAICDNMGLNNPDNEATVCQALDFVKWLLGNLQSMYPLQCIPEGLFPPSRTDPAGRVIAQPTPLIPQITRTGLPAQFSASAVSRLMQTEGPTYHWLFRNILHFMSWAPCGVLGQETPYLVPDEWEHVGMLDMVTDLRAYKLKQAPMPYAAVLRRVRTPQAKSACMSFMQTNPQQRRAGARRARSVCAGDELVIAVRGTTVAFEWFVDFDYAMVSDPAFGDGLMHRGFHGVADGLWSGLQNILDQYGSSAGSIIISGHSLGAAVAALLTARTQKYFAASSSPAPQLTAVLFGSPNVGDARFVADYNSRVDTRNIGFVGDMVTQVPCVGNQVDCYYDEGAAAGSTSTPGKRVGNVTLKYVSYERLGGVITITPASMPLQANAWSETLVYTQDDLCDNMITAAKLVETNHVCSYMCALSSVSTTTSGDWCLLWPQEGVKQADGASYCMDGFSFFGESDFPSYPLFPSIKDPAWLRARPGRRGPQNRTRGGPAGQQAPRGL